MAVLITGGAGYIGGHVVAQLRERGEEVLVVDDLSTGVAERIDGVTLVTLDLAADGSEELLAKVMAERTIDAVVHFAGRKQVGESVERPTWYWTQNVGGLLTVVRAMESSGCRRIVFSSSASVYGISEDDLLTETAPTQALSPYGRTKLVGEQILDDAAAAGTLDPMSLRYFNAAGAAGPLLGDTAVQNLIPMVLERLDAGEPPRIFGDDYPTPDGTCVRDYVHVVDLARAHLLALDHLVGADERRAAGEPASPTVVNVGTGVGSSVREVLAAVRAVTGDETQPVVVPRRPGDPPRSVADVTLARELLGFTAELGLVDMVDSAWKAWRSR
ncbi:UDP-glucose 4-epimerase GalE [Georgenia sp. Z1491]|uniref:UDP-glucose 4-epimerase GalE n=1 Tax=Georgenia sp. Z1491 TaxID=3416707 RepID=UPI003CFB39D3